MNWKTIALEYKWWLGVVMVFSFMVTDALIRL